MNMDKVFSKLRRYNRGNYVQLVFCIAFAVLLVTSFAATMYSKTVQTVLPLGGDSRKQVNLIFAVALIGCLMFSVYAASLFFKYKSRETGVFLALGASKRILAKAFYKELGKILLACSLVGIIVGNITSFLIWQLFRLLVIDTSQMAYRFSPIGTVIGLVFSLVVGLFVLGLAYLFMKRSNLMDILNEQRKNEPIQEVTKTYGLLGLVMVVAGLLLGYVVPMISANLLKFNLPAIWGVTYLLSVVGIYRILTYLISHHERGRRPQSYYKKIIPFSMMKFQGKQTVRNMCVMALLVLASLMALFYVPMNSVSFWSIDDNPVDFTLPFPDSIDLMNQADIESLAAEHGVAVTDYEEVVFAKLIGSGVERDWTDDGEFIEDYQEKNRYSEFISASDYQQATGEELKVPQGKYYILSDGPEGFWYKFDDLDKVTNPVTDESLDLAFAGDKQGSALHRFGIDRYVLNDADFAQIVGEGMPAEHRLKQLMFNVEENEAAQAFAQELFQLFVDRSPAEMARINPFDEYQFEQAKAANEPYGNDIPIELNVDNPDLRDNWKYYPNIKIIMKQNFLRDMAVYFLLFVYVAIICLAAVGIIGYTRSITIGINNKQLFDDLTKLGANKRYIRKTINSQLTKIFVFPMVIGGIVVMLYTLLIFWGNDRVLTPEEWKSYVIDAGLVVVVSLYIYIVYRASLKKLLKIVYQ